MKQLLLILLVCSFSSTISFAQKAHYWVQQKTTECKSHGIEPSIQVGSKVIKVGFAYQWKKRRCTETQMKGAIRIPKLKKGVHIAPDGKNYYYDGKRVFRIYKNSCGAKVWTKNEFWVMMQKM